MDGPILALDGAGHKVDAGVLAAELVVEGKLRPEPHLLEEVGIQGRGFQISLHEAFETVSFVAFGKGLLAEFIQKLGECAHVFGLIQNIRHKFSKFYRLYHVMQEK